MQNKSKPRKGIMDWADKTAPQRRATARKTEADYRKASGGVVDPQGVNIRPKRKF